MSRSRSSKLLLGLASTVVLHFERRWKLGSLLRQVERFVFLSRSKICCTVQRYPHPHSVQKRAFLIYGHLTRFVAFQHWKVTYARYTQGMSMQASAADYTLNYFHSDTAVSDINSRRSDHSHSHSHHSLRSILPCGTNIKLYWINKGLIKRKFDIKA